MYRNVKNSSSVINLFNTQCNSCNNIRQNKKCGVLGNKTKEI